MQTWQRKLVDPFLQIMEEVCGPSIEGRNLKEFRRLSKDAFEKEVPSFTQLNAKNPPEIQQLTSIRKSKERKALEFW
jgi:hypothetical protein